MLSGSVKAEILVPEQWQEFLIADLAEMGFTGFEQIGDRLIAYISHKAFRADQKDFLDQLSSKRYPAEVIDITILKEENWNSIWESTIHPIKVGQFYIRPSWGSPINGDLIELIIDPKMAFGTGYHETTRLMLGMMSDLSFEGKDVLDAGTGTGILAIAALKLGASQVFAFDIDPWSKQNAIENSIKNGAVENFTVEEGDISVIPDNGEYDIILANINRNALIELIPEMAAHLTDNGTLCVSGLLASDRTVIQSVAESASLAFDNINSEGDWITLRFNKSASEAHHE